MPTCATSNSWCRPTAWPRSSPRTRAGRWSIWAASRQAHSRVVAVLQETHRAEVEGDDEQHAGAARQAGGHERGAPDDGDGGGGDAHEEAVPPPARQEVPCDHRHGPVSSLKVTP